MQSPACVTVRVASVGLTVKVSAWNGVQKVADAYYMSEIAYSFIGNSIYTILLKRFSGKELPFRATLPCVWKIKLVFLD